MKTIITLAVCVLLSLSLKAQTKEVIVKDSSGNILEIGYLNENDEKDAIWTMYNEKGSVVSEMEYEIFVSTFCEYVKPSCHMLFLLRARS